MNFKFATWNVNYRRFKQSHADFLVETRPHLLALQEVSSSFHATLKGLGIFDWSKLSLAMRPARKEEGPARRRGCSIFGRAPFRSVKSHLLREVALPERTLVTAIRAPRHRFLACSFHIPPGASWGEVKPKTMEAIASWLRGCDGELVVGMDANTPKVDHPIHAQNEWWWHGEKDLLGVDARHGLADTLRTFLDARPSRKNAISCARPRGPLAVSHVRGSGRSRTECRYDFLLATDGFRVLDVNYLYEASLTAGSDHALVIARLGMPE